MTHHSFTATLIVISASMGLLTSPKLSAADISDLHWLSGCWALDNQERGSSENWMSPAGGSMIGISRIVADGKTVAFEYMRIVTDDDGNIVFIATPSGQNTTRFEASSLTRHEVVFENAQHDFPQRIVYRLEDADTLFARISGEIDGVMRSADFPMTRTECVNGVGVK